MNAMQMMMNIIDEELEAQFPDYSLVDAMDTAIGILSGEKPEGSTSAAAKRLIDFRDAIQYPDDNEIRCMNEAIIALIAA